MVDRERQRGVHTRTGSGAASADRRTFEPLHTVPSVVLAACARGDLNVQLLPFVRTHVGQIEITGSSIEAAPPRVP